MNDELSRLTPEEVYGPDMTEMLDIPYEFCTLCHENPVNVEGSVCSACFGGEL